MTGITIDGRLDDWPKNLKPYLIQQQYLGPKDGVESKTYDPEPRDLIRNPDAYFKVDTTRGWIDLPGRRGPRQGERGPSRQSRWARLHHLKTDAVEVYVDGTFSERNSEVDRSNDAVTTPVLQYVGVPGEVPAYGDRWGANPSLLYTKTRERHTQMKYQRKGDVTTYEWAIQAYDQYPDRLTQLVPGKRIGFDLAVVNKDSAKAPPAWMYWGPE